MSELDGGMLLLGIVGAFVVTLVLVVTLPHASGRHAQRDPRRGSGDPGGALR